MRSLPALLFPLALAAVLVAQDPPTTPPPDTKFTLSGHTETVYAVAFSPDGRHIATGSFDRSVKLWDAANGKELRTLAGPSGHQNLVTTLAFSPDGSSLATAGTDNTARVWDVPTGKPQVETELTAGGTCVAVSRDEKLHAVGTADGVVKVFNAADNKLTQTISPANTGAVIGVGFNPNGQTLYTLAADKVLRYWNTTDGKQVGAVGATAGDVTAFAVNPGNGQPVVVTADGVVALFPTTPPKDPKELPPLGDAAAAFALSADGNVAVVATADKKLKAVRTTDANVLFDITLPGVASKLAVNSNGTQFLAVVGNRMHVLSNDGKPFAEVVVGPLLDVSYGSNQAQFVTLSGTGVARTWNLPQKASESKSLAHPNAVKGMAVTPDGQRVVTASGDNVLRVWKSNAVEREFKDHTTNVVAVGVAADNVVSADASGDVLFWNPNDAKQTAKLNAPKKAVTALGVLVNSKTVAVGYADEVRLFASPTVEAKDVKAFPHPKPVFAVEFASDRKKVISFCADGKVRVLSPDTGKEESSFDLTTKDKTTAVAVSADGTKFAEVGGGKLSVRQLGDGKVVFNVPAEEASAVGWSADGKLIAVGGKGAVAVFDAITGAALQTLAEPSTAVNVVGFLPDNKTVVFGGDDKQVSAAEVWVSGTRATTEQPTVGQLLASGNWAVVATADKTVRTFEINPAPDAKEVKAFPGLPADATDVTLARDRGLLAAVSGKTVKVWQSDDGKEQSIAPLRADGKLATFSNDRKKLAVALADNSAVVIDVESGRVEQVVRHAGPIVGLAIHPSQPVLFTTSADKTTLATALYSPRIAADSGRYGVAFTINSNGGNFLSSGNGKGVTVANAGNVNPERLIGEQTGVTALAVNKQNTQVATFTPADNTVTLFNYGNGEVIGRWQTPAAVSELSFHPTLNTLLGVLADKRVVAWNVRFDNGQPLPPEFGKSDLEFPHPTAMKGAAVAGDFVLTVADDKKLRAWKYVADTPRKTLQHPNGVNAVAFNNTGELLATGGQDGQLRIWDVSKKDNPQPKAIKAHVPNPPEQPRAIYAVVWTPDGKQVATASDDRSIKLWDAESGNMVYEIKPGVDSPPTPEEVKGTAPAVVGGANVPALTAPPPPGHVDQVYSLAITPNGKFLASGSADKTVKLWEVATGQPVRAFVTPGLMPEGTAHPGFVQCVRFTPDGNRLVSVGSAPKGMGFVAVWNVADGKSLATYTLPIGSIYSVDLTADGTAVFGCGPKTRGASDSDAVVIPLGK